MGDFADVADWIEGAAVYVTELGAHDGRRRDHALLLVVIQTGLRVSELVALTLKDVHLGTGLYLRCHGKGRNERCTPLTAQTVAVLRQWLEERRGQGADPLFATGPGTPLGRDAVERLVRKYTVIAESGCPSLRGKRLSPHVLRHTAAMQLLHAGADTSVIALWLGHEGVETTQIYLHADLSLKERALGRTAPLDTVPGRYRAPDSLLAFLDGVIMPTYATRTSWWGSLRGPPVGIKRESASCSLCRYRHKTHTSTRLSRSVRPPSIQCRT